MSARDELYVHLRDRILDRRRSGAPVVVGITGIDTSGKTEFTKGFADRLEADGLEVQVVHLDDFHRPRHLRYLGPDEAENYFLRSFDLDTLVEQVLRPIQQVGALDAELTLLDLDRDTYSHAVHVRVGPETVVLLEGVFLLRPELRPFLDFSVYLDIPEEEVLARAALRDVPRYGEAVLAKYDTKYLPAQRRYIEAVRPHALADVLIDNRDVARPTLAPVPR